MGEDMKEEQAKILLKHGDLTIYQGHDGITLHIDLGPVSAGVVLSLDESLLIGTLLVRTSRTPGMVYA